MSPNSELIVCYDENNRCELHKEDIENMINTLRNQEQIVIGITEDKEFLIHDGILYKKYQDKIDTRGFSNERM